MNSLSIVINGTWGSGKTSFMNALKGELKEHHIIEIEPNIENDLQKMLRNLSIQFEEICNEKGIYTGKGSSFSEYFSTFLKIVSEPMGSLLGFFVPSNFSEIDKSFCDVKKALNMEIKNVFQNNQSNSKIVILVDDLDRCNNETKINTLSFINEIAGLSNCVIVFFADLTQFKNDVISSEYLDKYFYKRTY